VSTYFELDGVKVHPAAAAFPMLQGEDMVRLQNDISGGGQKEPIIFCGDVLIDGRNRYVACKRARRAPRIKRVDLDERGILRYIVSANLRRRHLTESQRAMIASELAQLQNGSNQHGEDDGEGAPIGAPSVTQDQAADLMQVSRRSVQRARQVKKDAPDLAERVTSGELKVSKAAAMARARKPQTQDKQAAAVLPQAVDDDFQSQMQSLLAVASGHPASFYAKPTGTGKDRALSKALINSEHNAEIRAGNTPEVRLALQAVMRLNSPVELTRFLKELEPVIEMSRKP